MSYVISQRGGSKRICSLSGSLRNIAQSNCVRVFARWPPCKHFYPGFAHSRSPMRRGFYAARFMMERNARSISQTSVRANWRRERGVCYQAQAIRSCHSDQPLVYQGVRPSSGRYRRGTGRQSQLVQDTQAGHRQRLGKSVVYENLICTLLQAQGLNSSMSRLTTVNSKRYCT